MNKALVYVNKYPTYWTVEVKPDYGTSMEFKHSLRKQGYRYSSSRKSYNKFFKLEHYDNDLFLDKVDSLKLSLDEYKVVTLVAISECISPNYAQLRHAV